MYFENFPNGFWAALELMSCVPEFLDSGTIRNELCVSVKLNQTHLALDTLPMKWQH